MGDTVDTGDVEYDSDVEVAVQEAMEEQQRKEQEAKVDEGKIAPGELDMRMTGKSGPPPGMMPKIRKGTKACNTGPKGVKADYEEAKLIQQFKNFRMAMRAERELKKKAYGRTDYSQALQKNQSQDQPEEEKDSDLDEDDEDDAFFQQYKQQKLDMVKNSLPTYGKFYRVKKNEFIRETEHEHELIHVVVHLYKNYIPACVRLNLILEDIAPQFTHVKFIRCRSDDLLESFSDTALPMLLVYRGSNIVHTIPQVSKYFPKSRTLKWDDEDVVKYLGEKGILNQAIYEKVKVSKREKRLKDDY